MRNFLPNNRIKQRINIDIFKLKMTKVIMMPKMNVLIGSFHLMSLFTSARMEMTGSNR